MSLPKYFENLTLGIGAISGDARIVSVNKKIQINQQINIKA